MVFSFGLFYSLCPNSDPTVRRQTNITGPVLLRSYTDETTERGDGERMDDSAGWNGHRPCYGKAGLSPTICSGCSHGDIRNHTWKLIFLVTVRRPLAEGIM